MNAFPDDVAMIRSQQRDARHPGLLRGPWRHQEGVLWHRERQGSGLISVVVRHDALSQQQRRALGAFRLGQFVLCGWYDVARVMESGATVDPQMDVMPADALHLLVGTRDGSLLAYACLRPAQDFRTGGPMREQAQGVLRAGDTPDPLIGDPTRPLFPSESGLFHPQVFASLPQLRKVPISQVLDVTSLLRNQALHKPLEGMVAAVEVAFAMEEVTARPDARMRALVGSADRESRRLLDFIGCPVLYAPLAPIAPDPLASEQEPYWSEIVYKQGEFWPCVIALDDVRASARHYRRLDDALSLPTGKILRALTVLRRTRQTPVARTMAPLPGETDVLWTADPYFTLAPSCQRAGRVTPRPLKAPYAVP